MTSITVNIPPTLRIGEAVQATATVQRTNGSTQGEGIIRESPKRTTRQKKASD
jgi:hypothetical protein